MCQMCVSVDLDPIIYDGAMTGKLEAMWYLATASGMGQGLNYRLTEAIDQENNLTP